MKRSAKVTAPLLASLALSMTTGCRKPEMQRCVDENNKVVDDSLCMFSFYDGDFSNYIRDFIYNVGSAFDGLLSFIKDHPPLPVEQHPDEFIQWVHDHDALQLEYPTSVLQLGPEDDRDIVKMTRRLILLLDECSRTDPPKNVQLFAYRSYPVFTVAQIRHAFKIGW